MAQQKLSYLNLYTTDPAWNLAAEQYVFVRLPRDRTYFMLWQNDNAIIIGKHQNTAAEINEAFVRENGVRVVRRLSGGGAVYHDMGNLNFTFIADAGDMESINFRLFCRPWSRAGKDRRHRRDQRPQRHDHRRTEVLRQLPVPQGGPGHAPRHDHVRLEP